MYILLYKDNNRIKNSLRFFNNQIYVNISFMEREFQFYIVSTPIGNLNDITLRAIDVLKNVDFILCEDTRNTIKLINHFDINKPLIAYHKFNEAKASDSIINRIKSGQTAALVSDAGSPLISDPGNTIVKLLIENNIDFCVLPGANAVIPSLIMSGFDIEDFYFAGFLPKKQSERVNRINEIFSKNTVSVLYVSPHELKSVLKLIDQTYPSRKLSLAKELTKIHETIYRGTASEIELELPDTIKGEYTLTVCKNEQKASENKRTDDEMRSLFSKYSESMSKKDALKKMSEELKISKNELYDLLMK